MLKWALSYRRAEMQRRIITIMSVTLLTFLVYPLFAAPKETKKSTTSYGAGLLNNLAIDSHTAHGSLNVSNSTISEKLTVNGALTCDNVVVNHVDIHGAAQFSDTEITGQLTIHGAIQLSNSKLVGPSKIYGALLGDSCSIQGDMDISTNKLRLNDCHTKNILIRYSTSKRKQLVELSGKTVIDGDITFEAKDGEIYIEPNVVIKGMVYGGTVKEVTSNDIHRESRRKP